MNFKIVKMHKKGNDIYAFYSVLKNKKETRERKREMNFKTMELLHEMAIYSIKDVERKFGTDWRKTQEILKENLFNSFPWKGNVTKVTILKRNGEILHQNYSITKNALFECVRDGFYVVPYFTYTFKVWNADTRETIETIMITSEWKETEVFNLFEDWEFRNNIDIGYYDRWCIIRH